MTDVLADLDRLEANRKLDPSVPVGQGGAEMRRANLAIVTHNKLASDHLRPLVAALEQVRSPGGHMPTCIAVGGHEGCVPKCLDASEALAALQRDIAKEA